MLSSLCKFSLTFILRVLDRILPPTRPALPAAPTKSAAPTIDLTPDQVEQLAVAEEVIKLQALNFQATPISAPAFGGELRCERFGGEPQPNRSAEQPLSRTDPAPVKIVSWAELPGEVGMENEASTGAVPSSFRPRALKPKGVTVETLSRTVQGMSPSGTTSQGSAEVIEREPPTSTPTRGQLVEGLLDEGWQQGLRTYAQLMKYIELQTGTACSKRVVSAWKKSRQRTEAEAA